MTIYVVVGPTLSQDAVLGVFADLAEANEYKRSFPYRTGVTVLQVSSEECAAMARVSLGHETKVAPC